MSEETHLVLTPVLAERADDFERFLTEVVQPAVKGQRPNLAGRWQILRSTQPADGVVTYAFLFDGGSLDEDWELDNLLPAHYGQEQAERLVGEWLEAFAPVGPWAESAAAAGQEFNQVVWTLRPVALPE